MPTVVLTWLTSSIGKTAAKWASFAAVAVAVYWRIYADGQAAERAKQVAAKLDAERSRERIHDDVSKLPDADVRDELARWVRNGGRLVQVEQSDPTDSRGCRHDVIWHRPAAA